MLGPVFYRRRNKMMKSIFFLVLLIFPDGLSRIQQLRIEDTRNEGLETVKAFTQARKTKNKSEEEGTARRWKEVHSRNKNVVDKQKVVGEAS